MRVVALIPAAGRGKRMGESIPKAFLPLGGVPLLARTLQKFEACPQIDEILPLVPGEEILHCQKEIVERFGLRKVSGILAGGAERQDSVFAGLTAIQGKADWVVIHDGARPLVTVELIERILAAAKEWKAAVAALPAWETVKEVSEDGEVRRTLDRRSLWIIQTPQSFEYRLLFGAYEKAREEGFLGTDDASLVERLGVPVRVVEGEKWNLKITTPKDLALAEALLKIQ